MPINFFEAVDFLGSYRDGVPHAIQEKILETIEVINHILPGIREAIEFSDLRIVYDEKNRHRVFGPDHRGHRGVYYWPLHAMYLAKTGIRYSIAHEIAHVLDMLAGPTISETSEKFGKKFICPRSLYCFYPKGGKVIPGNVSTDFDQQTNFMGWFLVKIIVDARLTRGNKNARDNMLVFLQRANVDDESTNHFLTERVAQLMEEFVFTFQVIHGINPHGVFDGRYFSHPTHGLIFWGSDWLMEHEEQIRQFFNALLGIIFKRHNSGSLEGRIVEFHNEHKTPISISSHNAPGKMR